MDAVRVCTWDTGSEAVTNWTLLGMGILCCVLPARAADLSEYGLKSAFIYNFARFTEWPPEVGPVLTLCIVGPDRFGAAIDALQDKPVGQRTLTIQRKRDAGSLGQCQIVYFAPAAIDELDRAIEHLQDSAVLTVADTPGAAKQGVALNMVVVQGKVAFEANLAAARRARLKLSSKLLQLATQVLQ
jgi:hypothetical protein